MYQLTDRINVTESKRMIKKKDSLNLIIEKKVKLSFVLIIAVCIAPNIIAQEDFKLDKFDTTHEILNFGYGYDSLLTQLETWRQSPHITIDSIGASVLGRAIWMLTIRGMQSHFLPIYRVAIHARTHPNEVQSEMLSHRIIEYLIEDSPLGELLRDRFVFHIVPMYNPDGVELRYGRQNANYVDLERNWFTYPHEPEVEALKNKYLEFMESFLPIRIALNMHGDGGAAKDYFVFHHENGTSAQFVEDQKKFITAVRNYWVNGIHDWNYMVSWTDGNPLVYPESWFWENYAESVMALTHEKCPTQNDAHYDSSAFALLNGIIDYLEITSEVEDISDFPEMFSLYQNYPNPFNSSTRIEFSIYKSDFVILEIFDALGIKVKEPIRQELFAGNYSIIFNAENLPNGIYYYRLIVDNFTQIKKAILLK
jgi:hypothetical protein